MLLLLLLLLGIVARVTVLSFNLKFVQKSRLFICFLLNVHYNCPCFHSSSYVISSALFLLLVVCVFAFLSLKYSVGCCYFMLSSCQVASPDANRLAVPKQEEYKLLLARKSTQLKKQCQRQIYFPPPEIGWKPKSKSLLLILKSQK